MLVLLILLIYTVLTVLISLKPWYLHIFDIVQQHNFCCTFSKINFYEPIAVNKKKYYPGGTKRDNLGTFDWYSEEGYKIKDAKDRFLGGSHEFNSMLLANKYIPLNFEETVAISNHHFGMSDKNPTGDLSAIANRFPLLTLLHIADIASTYLSEREVDE